MEFLPEDVKRYLEKYAPKEWEIERLIPNLDEGKSSIDTVVVIPAIKELENIKKLISSLVTIDNKYFTSTLFLIVINNTVSATAEIKDENFRTMRFLRQCIWRLVSEDALNRFNSENDEELITSIYRCGLRIGLADASSEGNEMPDKDGGVGLARKIGMDGALRIFDYNSPAKKLLICLDADCIVSENYLTEIHEQFYNAGTQAASIHFEHRNEDAPLTDAIICYELFLRYYVLSLTYAGSDYAFHTIGSAMACTHDAYIKVEGMNKKKAAEDFYFLEKLAKITPVKNISGAVVYPSGRDSWRVPFGTGQRVNRFHTAVQDEYLLYNPLSFDILKKWVSAFTGHDSSPDELMNAALEIDSALSKFLELNNFRADWNKIVSSSKTQKQLNKQKHKWFDGFKTLKLMHFLRDNGFPNSDMFSSINSILDRTGAAFDSRSDEKIPNYEIRMKYLQLLRDLQKS